MKGTSKRRVLLLLAGVLLLLFLVRPGANRLRTRIASSMSMALGRQVEIGRVNIHLLPQPGFDLENLALYDDPTISAEPMLRAGEVVASLRLSSIFRGRLEISRLSLSEPSLNIVRSADGRWNLEGLVEQASKSPVAPTTKTVSEARPGFPYIEASGARVNIKLGQEKKAFALTDADLAVWQDSENSWGLRLRAKPVRTDFNLSDTGTLRVDGMWRRAPTLSETPMQFALSWQGAQLGQLTKLVFARDRGWRGGVDVSANLTGTPSDLTISTQAEIQDFRRYDIMGGNDIRLATQCATHFHSSLRRFQDIDCQSTIGDGTLRLTGDVADALGSRSYDLKLTADRVPAQALVSFARRAKKGLPGGLAATGTVQAVFTAQKAVNSAAVYQGQGHATGVTIGDSNSDAEAFDLGKIAFVTGAAKHELKPGKQSVRGLSGTTELSVSLPPFPVSLDRPAPALAGGTLSRSGYSLRVQGEGRIQRFLQFAGLLGIPVKRPPADGIAKVDLTVAGTWEGFAPPRVEGSAQIRSVRAEIRGTASPIEVSAGQVSLTTNEARFDKIAATFAGGHWSGSVVVPRDCAGEESCFARFDLQAETISTDELARFLAPAPGKRPWYRVLSAKSDGPSPFASLRASGTLRAKHLAVRKILAANATTKVDINEGVLQLSDLRAHVLGGDFRGNWKADFNVRPYTYVADGKFDRISLEELTELLGGNWAAGTGGGTVKIKASGNSTAAIQESVDGVLEFEIRGGKFSRVTLPGSSETLVAQRFAGQLERRDGKFVLNEGRLQNADGTYQLSGTILSGSKLNLKLVRTGFGAYSITGSLAEPHVVADKTTQAALKP